MAMYWFKRSFFICVICFSACQAEQKEVAGSVPETVFDLKSFFEAETQRLSSDKNCSLKRNTSIDGKEEVSTVSSPNWSALLKPFMDSDINKPTWLENYRFEESEQGGNKVYHYRSAIEKMKTQDLQIVFKGKSDVVESVGLTNVANNFILSSSENLYYVASPTSFKIEKSQQYFFFDPQRIDISGSCR